MAPIIKRGESYRAIIRRRGFKPITKTFRNRTAAATWVRKIESDLDNGIKPHVSGKTVADVILHYRELREGSREIPSQSNEHYMLAHLEEGLGNVPISRLTPEELTGWCRRRSAEGAGPYTISMELSKLGTALKFAGMALGLPHTDVIERVRPMLSHRGLIGVGRRRERRPTQDELDRILNVIAAPYDDVVQFVVVTAMRRGEITTIKWDDLDRKKKAILIRNRKHPQQKIGNDQIVPLLGDSWAIIEHQKKTDARIGECMLMLMLRRPRQPANNRSFR